MPKLTLKEYINAARGDVQYDMTRRTAHRPRTPGRLPPHDLDILRHMSLCDRPVPAHFVRALFQHVDYLQESLERLEQSWVDVE